MNSSTQIPNTFIIGAPKCGTTSLFNYLSDHPAVFSSALKEPKFWSPDLPNPAFMNQPMDAYMKLFRGALPKHKAIIDGSTTYLQSDHAIRDVLKFNPRARFIAMLRNPISFLPSYHMELCLTFHEDKENLQDAWNAQELRRQGRAIPAGCIGPLRLDYFKAASFGEQLNRLFNIVPESQRMVILFDDFTTETKIVYQRVLNFLDLQDDGREVFPQFHQKRQYRFQAIRRLWIRPPRLIAPIVTPLRRALGVEGINLSRFINRHLTLKGQRTELPPEFRNHLRSIFADDIRLTSKLVDRDLSHWLAPA